ncbi:MAG: hypothetical protein JO237_14280 [Pseudolabrys sp.]|nr:hypothetical protein [Pseudolabrys sp.]
MSIVEALHEWHEFYVMVGGAAAVLLGLLFVAASLGEGLTSRKSQALTRMFMSPIVIHFSSVLFICTIGVIPPHRPLFFSAIIGATGLAGTVVSIVISVRLFNIWQDHSDHLAYGLVPVVGYLLVFAAAIMMATKNELSLDVLAAGILALLLVNIRNVWDLTLAMVRRRGRRRKN